MPATAESHTLEPFEETLVPIKEGQAGVQDEASTSPTRSRPRSDSAISLAEKAISLPRGHSSQLLATQQQDIDLVDSIKLTWERDVERQIREKYAASDHTPFLVGLVGIPGSGKSTSSSILQDMLATESMIDGEEEDAIPTIVIPMVSLPYFGASNIYFCSSLRILFLMPHSNNAYYTLILCLHVGRVSLFDCRFAKHGQSRGQNLSPRSS